MKFTGERYVPSVSGAIEIEHLHRYAVARSLAVGKSVLDLACGEGYGTALLAEVAAAAVGVDISAEAIDHARRTYGSSGTLRFVEADAIATPLENHSFDLIVSFETIEHISRQADFLKEIRRLLRPNGLLLISSPNRPVYNEGRERPNSYHVAELDFVEFNALLSESFRFIEYYGQRLLIGDVMFAMGVTEKECLLFSGSAAQIDRFATELRAPTYFVALCSNSQVVIPRLDASIFFPTGYDLVEHYVRLGRWAKRQDDELTRRKSLIGDLNAQIEELNKRVTDECSQLAEKAEYRVLQELARAVVQLSLLNDIFNGNNSESL